MRAKRIFALLLALCSLAALPGCGSDADTHSLDAIYASIPESTGGKDVEKAPAVDNVFSLNSNSRYSLNPLVATNHANQLICSLVYENMLELDNDFQVISNIINIEESYCNEDATGWTLKINPGHVFHDGSEVTAKDVYYSIERSIWSDRYNGRFGTYLGASYGETNVYVTLSSGNRIFPKLLNIPVIKSGTFNDAHPTGSGPYTYNEDYTALVSYEGYPDAANVPVKTIYIQEYTSAVDIISAFEDGYIDAVVNDPSSYSNLGYASTNDRHSFATTNMHYVQFNTESDLGKNMAFRYACNYAFDRSYMVAALGDNAVTSTVPMYPTCADYPTALANSYQFNMDTCKIILANAGLRQDESTGKFTYNGGRIELRFVLCSDSSAKSSVARHFASEMAALGIDVVVQELAWADYIKALEDGEFDLYYGEVRVRNDFDISKLFEERTEDNETKNINYTGMRDATYEQYIRNYLAASNADRANRYAQLCEYLVTTGGLITIGFEKQELITHRGVTKGVNPNYGNPFYNFTNWTIDLD